MRPSQAHPEDVARIAPTVRAIAKDPAAAKAKAIKAPAIVKRRQQVMLDTLTKNLKVA